MQPAFVTSRNCLNCFFSKIGLILSVVLWRLIALFHVWSYRLQANNSQAASSSSVLTLSTWHRCNFASYPLHVLMGLKHSRTFGMNVHKPFFSLLDILPRTSTRKREVETNSFSNYRQKSCSRFTRPPSERCFFRSWCLSLGYVKPFWIFM